MESEHPIPIWFFIGALILIYGIIIVGAGIHSWMAPPPEAERVALFELHADVWWGLFLTLFGGFYFIRFNPLWKR
jgi:hypothetical protein